MYYQGRKTHFQKKKKNKGKIKREQNDLIYLKELVRESSKVLPRERVLKNCKVPYQCKILERKSELETRT